MVVEKWMMEKYTDWDWNKNRLLFYNTGDKFILENDRHYQSIVASKEYRGVYTRMPLKASL